MALLCAGYLSAAAGAVFAALSGMGLLAAFLIFWLGGAVATLAIGMVLVYGGALIARAPVPFPVPAPRH